MGSYHCPIVLDTGDNEMRRNGRFFFYKKKKKWFCQDNFLEVVQENWKATGQKMPMHIYSLDKWNGSLVALR